MLNCRPSLLLAFGACAAALLSITPASAGEVADASASPTQQSGRVVVLGMDGMDASMAEEWIAAGELPNFARLEVQGTFAPLMPANPAQSPVSWATLNTGLNPGGHGIFDFVGVQRGKRNNPVVPTYGFQQPVQVSAADAGLPYAGGSALLTFLGIGAAAGAVVFLLLRKKAGNGVAGGLALVLVAAGGWYGWSWTGVYPERGFQDWESEIKADPFWVELDQAGVAFRGQGTIVSYPVQELEHGKLVAGLGAPDATGGLNSSAIYTTGESRERLRRIYEAHPAYALEDAPEPSVRVGKRSGSVDLYRMLPDGDGAWTSKIYGPPNGWLVEKLEAEEAALGETGADPTRLREVRALLSNSALLDTWVPLRAEWSEGDTEVALTVDGAAQQVVLGTWSDYYELEFRWNERLVTHALVRVWAEQAPEGLELFASPLQIHPDHPTPGSRICWPPDFASGLRAAIGDFETLGWACQTHAVKDAELSDLAFLADIQHTHEWRMRMLEDALEDEDWGVLFHFFGTPDRVCHMLMRHMDEAHPQYDAALAAQVVDFLGEPVALKDTGLAIYKEMDRVVGWLLDEKLGEDDVLLIVSDHGFDSFRREVNLNNWLVREGFTGLDDRNRIGVAKTADQVPSGALQWVDWGESQAYAVAIGKIYLNLRGREARGTVAPSDADAVLDEIVARLYALEDPETGEKVVEKVYRRDEIYSGDWVRSRPESETEPAWSGAAELTIDFVPGYRASWSSTGGGIDLVDAQTPEGEPIAVAGPVFKDNESPWSGDHCGVDLQHVQGIFFSSVPMALPEGDAWYDATHLAPTVLELVGVPVPTHYERQPLQR